MMIAKENSMRIIPPPVVSDVLANATVIPIRAIHEQNSAVKESTLKTMLRQPLKIDQRNAAIAIMGEITTIGKIRKFIFACISSSYDGSASIKIRTDRKNTKFPV